MGKDPAVKTGTEKDPVYTGPNPIPTIRFGGQRKFSERPGGKFTHRNQKRLRRGAAQSAMLYAAPFNP